MNNNQTPFKLEEIEMMDKIGHFKNEWRGRYVSIYQHPHHPESVITIGRPFDGGLPICTVEDKSAFKGYIGYFNKIMR